MRGISGGRLCIWGFRRRLNSLGLECPINRRPQLLHRLCATREPFPVDEYLGRCFHFQRSAKLEGGIDNRLILFLQTKRKLRFVDLALLPDSAGDIVKIGK